MTTFEKCCIHPSKVDFAKVYNFNMHARCICNILQLEIVFIHCIVNHKAKSILHLSGKIDIDADKHDGIQERLAFSRSVEWQRARTSDVCTLHRVTATWTNNAERNKPAGMHVRMLAQCVTRYLNPRNVYEWVEHLNAGRKKPNDESRSGQHSTSPTSNTSRLWMP